MKPNRRFQGLHMSFWAHVRAISETVGYAERGRGKVKAPGLQDVIGAMHARGLAADHLSADGSSPTELGAEILAYLRYRARTLNDRVEPLLMDAPSAEKQFHCLREELHPTENCPLPMIKQKGKKRTHAYLTCMVNMIVEAHSAGMGCDYDPRALTTITRNGAPLRTLSRWMDGAFPDTVNPVAVWEIKEHYHTTTFGSRVADAVYESLMDGMELDELRRNEGIKVLHYLIVDAHYTWWKMGRSYLCRILDAMHMGYVDEALFGREVVQRLPVLVRKWVRLARRRST